MIMFPNIFIIYYKFNTFDIQYIVYKIFRILIHYRQSYQYISTVFGKQPTGRCDRAQGHGREDGERLRGYVHKVRDDATLRGGLEGGRGGFGFQFEELVIERIGLQKEPPPVGRRG